MLTINVTAMLLLLATGCLLQGLKSKPYSPIGTYPHSWLSKDYIKNNDGSNSNNNYILGIVIARILVAFENNLKTSDASNAKRLKILNLSLFLCQIALIPFSVFFIANIIGYLL